MEHQNQQRFAAGACRPTGYTTTTWIFS